MAQITNSEILLNDYLIFRSDRKSTDDKKPHGGTITAIQSTLNCRRSVRADFDSSVICEIQVNNSKMLFFSFYNPVKDRLLSILKQKN